LVSGSGDGVLHDNASNMSNFHIRLDIKGGRRPPPRHPPKDALSHCGVNGRDELPRLEADSDQLENRLRQGGVTVEMGSHATGTGLPRNGKVAQTPGSPTEKAILAAPTATRDDDRRGPTPPTKIVELLEKDRYLLV
jgi:hypothetical protein